MSLLLGCLLLHLTPRSATHPLKFHIHVALRTQIMLCWNSNSTRHIPSLNACSTPPPHLYIYIYQNTSVAITSHSERDRRGNGGHRGVGMGRICLLHRFAALSPSATVKLCLVQFQRISAVSQSFVGSHRG
ncbi:hypothetical protein BJ165DRAFT_870780 [Panaeolus papilionaceus]|nr:hypothetical protein BJ165DRAFT_870780 [Panaeolus papilionaceus]